MVKRRQATQAVAPQQEQQHGEYEQNRIARMRENNLRMQQLGLATLSQSLFNESTGRRKKPSSRSSIPRSLEPARRSARLQKNPAPSYKEARERIPREKSERGSRRDRSLAGTGGPRPEIYTEEHEKLLGNAREEWELFVDGYDRSKKRIYGTETDEGKTCHQCRQKTLGLRTHCSECQIVQGQFCGDCLYTRYGENVKETLLDESWRCPVCRDICNCSVCRTKKGWAPTGYVYRHAIKRGYKSVAHFLIFTRRGEAPPAAAENEAAPEKSSEPDDEASAGREESDITEQAPPAEEASSEEETTAKRELEYDSRDSPEPEPEKKKPKRMKRGGKRGAASPVLAISDPVLVISDSEEDDEHKKTAARTLKRRRIQPARAAKA